MLSFCWLTLLSRWSPFCWLLFLAYSSSFGWLPLFPRPTSSGIPSLRWFNFQLLNNLSWFLGFSCLFSEIIIHWAVDLSVNLSPHSFAVLVALVSKPRFSDHSSSWLFDSVSHCSLRLLKAIERSLSMISPWFPMHPRPILPIVRILWLNPQTLLYSVVYVVAIKWYI